MMRRTTHPLMRAVGRVLCLVGLTSWGGVPTSGMVQAAPQWQIPGAASQAKSPVTPDEAVLRRGKALFADACATCHGPQGKGNGPHGDPEHPPANLTDPARAADNPDGVIFYKIWNGRRAPTMPAFRSRMTKDDVWTVIAYVKTLRATAGQ